MPRHLQPILLFFAVLPFWSNYLIRTYAWITILKQEGLLNDLVKLLPGTIAPFDLLYTPTAVVIGLVYTYLPFMILPIFGSAEKLDGALIEAAHDLGYHWTVMGEVVRGDQRGRAIGFPTLNIVLDPGAEPFRGIYAVKVRDAALRGNIHWPGAGYFGDRPTFDTGRTFLEVHLIGFDGDLYGRRIEVEFVARLRDEEKFDDLPSLVTQMDLDAAQARAVLAAPHSPRHETQRQDYA